MVGVFVRSQATWQVLSLSVIWERFTQSGLQLGLPCTKQKSSMRGQQRATCTKQKSSMRGQQRATGKMGFVCRMQDRQPLHFCFQSAGKTMSCPMSIS